MEKPVQFTLAQLTPAQQARVIAILVQMILRQMSKPVEEEQNDTLSTKIQVDHLQRLAYIYVRQSSLAQVQEHQESTRRQYELQQRAGQLGWPPESIVVVDADLGHSASNPHIPEWV